MRFHYYRKYWKPKEEELLSCSHEFGSSFYVFAIQTCIDEGNSVGHPPQEISGVSNFLLDKVAAMNAKFTSSHHRSPPLVQGGMKIACKITVKMRPTVKNCKILKRFLDLITTMYAEPEVPLILGSILMDDLIMSPEAAPPSDAKKMKNVNGAKQSSPGVNCRGFLKRAAQPSKALEIELVKKLSNMTFREGFLIFPQASNGCKEIKMYFFINFSINSSSDFFINIHIFTSLRTTEQQRHRTAKLKDAILLHSHAQ